MRYPFRLIVLPTLFALPLLILTSACHHAEEPPPLEQWRIYATTSGLPGGERINSFFVEYNDDVWAASDAGATQFSRYGKITLRKEIAHLKERRGTIARHDSLIDTVYVDTVAKVQAMARGKDGALWFAMKDDSAFYRYLPYMDYKATKIVLPYISAFDFKTVIADLDLGGEVWVVTIFGIGRYTPLWSPDGKTDMGGSWSVLKVSKDIPTQSQLDMIGKDPISGLIYVGTFTEAVYSYNPSVGSWNRIPLPDDDYDEKNFAFEDKMMWMATYNGVCSLTLDSYETREYSYKTTNGRFPRSAGSCVACDRRGVRAFGTDSGVVVLVDTALTLFNTKNSPLPSNHVTAVAYTMAGDLWIGTDHGIAVYNKRGIKY